MKDNDEYHEKMTILVADDASENIAVLSSFLKGFYRTKIATNGESWCMIKESPE